MEAESSINNIYDCITCNDAADIEYKSLIFTKDFIEDAQIEDTISFLPRKEDILGQFLDKK